MSTRTAQAAGPAPAVREPAAVARPVQARDSGWGSGFVDQRPQAAAQRATQAMADASPRARQAAQLRSLMQSPGPRSPSTAALQRFPQAMDDEGAEAFATLYDKRFHDKDDDEKLSADELTEVKSNVFMLTPFHSDDIQANCIGWARGQDMFVEPGNLYTWGKDGYTATAPDAGDAQIVLWGETNGEEDETRWEVLHASVQLTHAEIADRSKRFNGFSKITAEALAAKGIPNPCWTSAGGMGYGVFVHPRDWFEGGDFGTALKGMKA